MKWNPFSRHNTTSNSDAVSETVVEKKPEADEQTTTDSDIEAGLGYRKPSSRQQQPSALRDSGPKPYRIPSVVSSPPPHSPPHQIPLPSRRISNGPPPSSRRVSPSTSLHPPPSRRTSRKSYHSHHSRRPSKSTSPYRSTASPDADPDILPIRQPTIIPGKPLPPSDYCTSHQILYLVLISSFLPLIISGVINFAIAYGLYRNYARVTLWAFPSTLAGDAAVTIALTCVTTWFIEYVLVRRDLATGGVAPVGWIDEPDNDAVIKRLVRWFLFLSEEGLGDEWVNWGIGQLSRVGALTVGCMVIFWPPTVGILIAVGKKEGSDWVYEERWTPELFKMVLGGAMGAIVTPVIAGIWLVRGGLRYQSP
ncbi:hypothetical protein QBC43DRAFT_206165 [Cladorrhinum sp. PSN259]|nr:hypothetical protein QBC43DRAFT_206165 [Cladorrhinum sp. PSN259]